MLSRIPALKLLSGIIFSIASVFSVAATAMTGSTVTQGSFTEVNKRTSGSWSIEQRADGRYAVLSGDFKTKRAPDLKIFLSPRQADQITGKNATNGAAFVAELTSNKGGQAFKIPDSIKLDDFKSFVIHCEQYSVFWAAGSL